MTKTGKSGASRVIFASVFAWTPKMLKPGRVALVKLLIDFRRELGREQVHFRIRKTNKKPDLAATFYLQPNWPVKQVGRSVGRFSLLARLIVCLLPISVGQMRHPEKRRACLVNFANQHDVFVCCCCWRQIVVSFGCNREGCGRRRRCSRLVGGTIKLQGRRSRLTGAPMLLQQPTKQLEVSRTLAKSKSTRLDSPRRRRNKSDR